MSCARIHEEADAFLDGELGQVAAAEFGQHMAECPELARLVEGRRAFRGRLRTEVRKQESPADLEPRLRRQLDAPRSVPPRWTVLAVAASLLLAFGVMSRWRGDATLAVMQVGLRQHVHCAVERARTAQLPGPDEMARDLGHGYASLVPAMRNLPAGFRVTEAHRCTFQGRDYVHVIAVNGTDLVSLLVTKRASGEALAQFSSVSAGRYSVAAFETRGHLVFLVSDLEAGQNRRALERIMPAVSETVMGTEI